MMQIISIEYIKAHSRIDDIRNDEFENELLELYGESAEKTVLNLLNRSIESLYEEYGKIPAPIMHACLFLVDHSYSQRSPVTMNNLYTVPYTLDALIKPYMIL